MFHVLTYLAQILYWTYPEMWIRDAFQKNVKFGTLAQKVGGGLASIPIVLIF